jgi:hypothetical protein
MVYANQIITDTDDVRKRTEELHKLKPMTWQELTTLLPKEINDFKLLADDVNGYTVNTATILIGTYRRSDGAELTLQITDFAEKKFSSIRFMENMSKGLKEYGVTEGNGKTIDFMGGKALVIKNKVDDINMLMFVAEDRLLITASAFSEDMDVEQLIGALKNLKLKL